MASYLRPRRGKKATAESQNIVLKKGEIFFEVPTGGVGKGTGALKMGDGTTAYKTLPYFMQQTAAVTAATSLTVAFTEASSNDNATLLAAIKTGATVGTLMSNIKKLLSRLNSSVTQLNNDLANVKLYQISITTDSEGYFSIDNFQSCYGISSSTPDVYIEYTLKGTSSKRLYGRTMIYSSKAKYIGTFLLNIIGYKV